MEAKVQLYDVDNNRIGETFMRRARQLVGQQRALWVDGTQNAIRFVPDVEEEWEQEAAATMAEPPTDMKKGLYFLAEKRLQERKKFMWHSILFIPVAALIMGIFAAEMHAHAFATFLLGGWLTAYGFHFFDFRKKYFRTANRVKRHTLKLEAEVARLRLMGYDD